MRCASGRPHTGLHDRLEDTFRLEQTGDFTGCLPDYADTVGKDYDRIEIRRCWTTGNPSYLAYVVPDCEWCGLTNLVRVESGRRGGDQVTTDTRCATTAP